MTFKIWAEKWLNFYQFNQLKTKTINVYESIIEKHFIDYFGELKIHKIDYELVQKYIILKRNKLSNATINLHIVLLKSILLKAKDNSIKVDDSVFRIKRLKTLNAEAKAFSIKDQIAIEKYCIKSNKKNYSIGIIISLYTGLRIGELLALTWDDVDLTKDIIYAKTLSAAAYIKTIYTIFDWKPSYKYRISGIKHQKDDESLIIFDMTETEVFISQNENESFEQFPEDIEPFTKGRTKDILAFPSEWAESFGDNYYRQAQARERAILNKKWRSQEEGEDHETSEPLNVTGEDDLRDNIESLKHYMGQEGNNINE